MFIQLICLCFLYVQHCCLVMLASLMMLGCLSDLLGVIVAGLRLLYLRAFFTYLLFY